MIGVKSKLKKYDRNSPEHLEAVQTRLRQIHGQTIKKDLIAAVLEIRKDA